MLLPTGEQISLCRWFPAERSFPRDPLAVGSGVAPSGRSGTSEQNRWGGRLSRAAPLPFLSPKSPFVGAVSPSLTRQSPPQPPGGAGSVLPPCGGGRRGAPAAPLPPTAAADGGRRKWRTGLSAAPRCADLLREIPGFRHVNSPRVTL